MAHAEPARAPAVARSWLRWRFRVQTRTIVGLLAATIVFLVFLGLTHALRIARLQVVLSADESGPPGVDDPGFAQTASALADVPIVTGNAVQVLSNGDETFPPLVADLRGAAQSITMQMYFGKPGVVTDSVLRILAERARSGVLVHFMYDAIGGDRMPEQYRRELTDAGVRVVVFRPFRWLELDRFGYRSHSRVVVVDGRIGYTGGFGLDDKWLGDGRRAGQWRETNVRFTGPAVAQLQGAFVEEWAEATGELLFESRLFPRDQAASGPHTAGLLHSLPGAGPSSAERALALSIAGARRTLSISNAYFLPNRSFRHLLAEAVRRGVDVRVLTNGGETDNSLTQFAARARYEELLAAGVQIFEYRPAMMHAKTVVTDGAWSSIGSVNFDNRSLALNSETSLLILDRQVAAVMDSLFREDLQVSEEITLESVRRRSFVRRTLEFGASLLARVL
jgi:cardiolipin synthase